jgi:hypothetical protein
MAWWGCCGIDVMPRPAPARDHWTQAAHFATKEEEVVVEVVVERSRKSRGVRQELLERERGREGRGRGGEHKINGGIKK